MIESRIIDNPSIDDVFNLMKREVSQAINCVQIGKIEFFNPAENTASVSIVFKRKLKNGDELEYPVLKDCPVFKLSGGGACIHMPIEKGDYCLILFNDRCIDQWTWTGEVKTPRDTRCHDLADGIVLVGLLDPVSADLSPSIPVIDGGAKKIALKNNTGDLKTRLDTFIDQLSSTIDAIIAVANACAAITVTVSSAPGTSTVPINASTITGQNSNLTTYKSNLTTLKTNIGLLLDTGA